MKITFYGHSTFCIEIKGKFLLIDPFITGNPQASHIDISELKADYILLTHAHQDHVLDVEALAEKTDAAIISNYEIVMYYGAKNLKGFPISHGGTFKTGAFSVKYVNAIHTSSFEDGSYGGEPGGFVISSDKKSIYIAGDTAVTFDMKLIPIQTKLNAAIFPIGDTFTMGIEDAIIASDFVECNNIIGCHFDTFPSIKINKKEAIDSFAKKEKKLTLLKIGEQIEV